MRPAEVDQLHDFNEPMTERIGTLKAPPMIRPVTGCDHRAIAVGTRITACPPHRTRTGGIPAYGSHLGCLTAKRLVGPGMVIRGLGSQRSASSTSVPRLRSFWLRRRRVRRQRSATWWRNAERAPHVSRHGVIGEVAPHHLPQPRPCSSIVWCIRRRRSSLTSTQLRASPGRRETSD